MTALGGAGLILAALLAVLIGRNSADAQSVKTEGRIERFSFHDHSRAVAIVRVADGTTRAFLFDRQQVAHCRAGDRITYTQGPEGMTIDRCAP
jgi:hypothetical protein